jgi:hypothetical protein
VLVQILDHEIVFLSRFRDVVRFPVQKLNGLRPTIQFLIDHLISDLGIGTTTVRVRFSLNRTPYSYSIFRYRALQSSFICPDNGIFQLSDIHCTVGIRKADKSGFWTLNFD